MPEDKATPVEPTSEEKRPLWRRLWVIRTGQVLGGIIVALILTECMFRWRDDGAFPHVNFYVHDDELGVRLAANASQRLRFGKNPLTSIRTNSDGYRGADFGDAEADEILVVGDSQVFGLGVEEDETFSHQLGELTGRKVLNGGVPTYGPDEYTAVVREILAKRKVKTVVYTVNFVNDLFEAERPNRERHAVWDGWAVRSETAPAGAMWFPGRHWLMSKSHTVYALRRWLYERGPKLDDRGFDSEGTWEDVFKVGGEAATERSQREESAAKDDAIRTANLAQMDDEIDKMRKEIAAKMERAFPSANAERVRLSGKNPGDIVARNIAVVTEASRNIQVTAAHIRSGVAFRNRLAEGLNPEDAKHREAADTLAAEKKLIKQRAELHTRARKSTHVPSALEPAIKAVKAVTDEFGAELVVVALPIDVQVADSEWIKYGVENPIDMKPTRVLLSDLVSSAERIGARAVDVTGALESVEGAFLDKDIHMTPKGHRAVAERIAERLAGPPGVRHPDRGLPKGRSRIPTQAEWRYSPEITVKGSSGAYCETFFIREWFRLNCRYGFSRPVAVDVIAGGHSETLSVVTKDSLTLVIPILPGDRVELAFYWEKYQAVLKGTRAGEATPTLEFSEREEGGRDLVVSGPDQHLCNCQLEVDPSDYGQCTNLVGAPTRECMDAYSDDCEQLLLCARGDALALPPCAPGFANAGGNGQCFQLCSDTVPCAKGTCTPWQGTSICR